MNTNNWSFRIQQGIKRFMDLLVAVIGLIFLSPALAVIALAIRIDSPGSPIYSHSRIGKDFKPFHLYKFRSMTSGGDDKGYMEYLEKLIESDQGGLGAGLPYRKMNGDPRVTRVGCILRKFYLDELPQLVNVLKGEMSLVGPRPHVQLEVDHYTRGQVRRLSVKPGLTGYWQVVGKADCTFSELIQLDLDYIDHWSLKFDIQILIQTFLLMAKGGEGFWTRKAKETPEKVQAEEALPISNVFLYEKKQPVERDLTLVK